MEPKIVFLEKDLLKTVCHQIRQSGFRIDVILGISSGGLIPTRIIADELNIKSVDTIAVSSYNRDRSRGQVVLQLQKNFDHLTGKNVLVVDDLVDRGATMQFVVDTILKVSPKEIKTAVIYKKDQAIFEPDFFAMETPADEWINFSWDK